MLDLNDAPTGVEDNDERFLLFLIMGTFFGPDLKGEIPTRSILQRIAEGRPPYTSDQLVGSRMKISEIEHEFRYVLRNADQSVIPKPLSLHRFLHGNLSKYREDKNANHPQFPDLFPPALHPHLEQNTIVENIVFIRKPEMHYIDQDDIERFKKLSGLAELDDSLEDELAGRAMIKSGFALTGSAVKGQIGSSVGLLDIGECADSYLFRMSLPGVKRDARDFSCEVESDGKVLLRGVTSAGEKRVYRYTNTFEMQTQNLCPSGRFSISFKLPGPVNPHQFSGNFGTDGILEGIVMKNSHIVDG